MSWALPYVRPFLSRTRLADDDAAARAFGRRGVAAENVEVPSPPHSLSVHRAGIVTRHVCTLLPCCAWQDQLDEFKEFKKLTTSMRAQEQKDMQAGVRAAQKVRALCRAFIQPGAG